MDQLCQELDISADDQVGRSYLSHLTSLSLFQIGDQTRLLDEELRETDDSLRALTVRERDSFTKSQAATVLDQLPELTQAVANAEARIPQLDTAATFDTARLQESTALRKRNAILARNERKVQDLLDIPGLVRTCVLNGYYTEATSLAQQLDRIHARQPNSTTIASLVAQVKSHLDQMTLQLLQLMNTPIKLSLAIKVVGLLSRQHNTGSGSTSSGAALSEDELHYLFLKGRYDALQDMFSGLEGLRDAPDRYAKKYVEIFREQCFAILTQYRAVFDRAAVKDLASSDTPDINVDDAQDDFTAFRHNLLPHFGQRIVADLLTMLREFVPQLDGAAARANLLTQSLYAAQSLARVGCDFTPELVELFEKQEAEDLEAGKQIQAGYLVAAVYSSQREMARRLD
ncbi:hypothetical protein PYCC9005_002498 [Savitreella phatthalungensis]